MQGLFTEVSFSLEILGVLIAVLGFSGADKWVERSLRQAMENLKDNAPWAESEAMSYIPSWQNIGRRWREGGIWLTVTIAVYAIMWPVAIRDSERARSILDPIFEFLSPIWQWNPALIAVCVALFALLYYAIWMILCYQILSLTAGILWRVVWVLSRPPSGVLGSIGLLVASYNPLISPMIG